MAKSNALWKFLTKDVKMSSGEASQYMSGLSKTVSKNDEKAFVDHLRQKLSQGKVQGEHLDDTLSDSLKEALSVQNSLGVGLGDRIYNSTKYNQKYSSTEGLKQRLEALRDSDTKLRDLTRDTTKARSSEGTPAVRNEAQKNIQQDSFIRRLEGQRQYFENSRYSTSAEAAAQANIEEASQRGINKQLTGSQKEVGVSGSTAAAREEAELRNGNSPEAQKLQQMFREREAAEAAAQRNVEQTRSIGEQQFQKYQNVRSQQQTVNGATVAAANVEKSDFSTRYKQLKDQEDFARNQFASTPILSRVADEYGIKKNAAGLKDVRKIIEDRKQGVLGVGSEKPLQEGTLTYKPQALSDMKPEEWSEMEKKTGISDLGFGSKSVSNDNGMPIATTTRELSVDEAKLRSFIKQNDMPGTKAANDMFYGRIKKGLESQHASIMKSDLSNDEKIAKWKTAREEAIERLRNGATFQDYFFGNRVHHGLAGMAAITGTLGVAFGGHKSNAELYSSPF